MQVLDSIDQQQFSHVRRTESYREEWGGEKKLLGTLISIVIDGFHDDFVRFDGMN